MFEPQGAIPKWRMVYDVLKQHNVDDVITYGQLQALLGTSSWRGPVYKAMETLERNDSRTLKNERGVGYRVARATEHEGLARQHHNKSRRSLKRSVNKLASADRTQLTRDMRKRFDELELTQKRHADALGRFGIRLDNIERRQDKTENVVSELHDLLRRHGIDPGV